MQGGPCPPRMSTRSIGMAPSRNRGSSSRRVALLAAPKNCWVHDTIGGRENEPVSSSGRRLAGRWRAVRPAPAYGLRDAGRYISSPWPSSATPSSPWPPRASRTPMCSGGRFFLLISVRAWRTIAIVRLAGLCVESASAIRMRAFFARIAATRAMIQELASGPGRRMGIASPGTIVMMYPKTVRCKGIWP